MNPPPATESINREKEMRKKNKILWVTFARRIALMTVCIIGLAGTMQAQQTETMEAVKRTQWGVKAAMNIASLHFDASEGESENSKSFVGGAMGLTFGLHADNGKLIFGIGAEMGLAEANGKNFTVSGGIMHMHNTFLSVGYLF